MPILPENVDRYPPDWPEISRRVRYDRAKGLCEECGVANHALGCRDQQGRFLPAVPLGCDGEMPRPGAYALCQKDGRAMHGKIIRIVLTVAHLNHTPEDCRDDNLKALCQSCHLRLDHALHLTNRVRCPATPDIFSGKTGSPHDWRDA